MDISHAYQLMHLVQNTVDVRMNAIDNGKTSLFNQILPFVSGDMLFMDIALLFQPALFLAERDGRHSVIQRPLDIGVDYLHHSLLVFSHTPCEYQFSIFDTYLFCTEQAFQPGTYSRQNRIRDVFLSLRIGGDGCGYSLTNIQHGLQAVQV